MPDSLMIFAAGFGTRMGALTRDRPKPLIEVAGTPLIDHALGLAREAGIGRIVANTHYLAGMMGAHLAAQGVTVSEEQPEILDTGGGLRQALPLLGTGPVLTLNPDAIWTGPNPLSALSAAWEAPRMGALLMLVPADQAAAHRGKGDFDIAPDGRLTRGSAYVYTGAQVLAADRLGEIADPVFSLNRYWDLLARDGRLYGIVHPGDWCDVGTPEGIDAAEALLDRADV